MARVLEPPQDFRFPFTPYPIQHDFMTALYSVVEGGKLGIFESPTGTGKSMSMICGALTWLEEHEERVKQSLMTPVSDPEGSESTKSSDWIAEQAVEREKAAKNAERLRLLRLIEAKEKEMTDIKQRVATRRRSAQKEKQTSAKNFNADAVKKEGNTDETTEEEDLLLEEYSETDKKGEEEEEEKEAEEEYQVTKVFFCSRTHSQLSQLVTELRRSDHANKRVACLASRQSYCVNPSVRALGNMSLINERCLELQQGKTTTARDGDGNVRKRARKCVSCPQKVQERIQELREEILADVQDVEDLVKKSIEMKACPYYAVRAAVKDAQVVLLPYNTLLHSATREASGISLKNNVVIVDEAHNLLDTIAHMHSAEVTGQQLTDALAQLNRYRSRYKNRFSFISILRLDQMIHYLGRLLRLLRQGRGASMGVGVNSVVYRPEEFVSAADIYNINPYMLLEFCQKSKLARKLRGFADKCPPDVTIHEKKPAPGLTAFLKGIHQENVEPENEKTSPVVSRETESKNPILPVLSFLECLTNSCDDGRVVCSRNATVGSSRLKYLLLNPAEHFKDVVRDARAVIVAGGTMQPLTEFKDQLFLAAGGAPERLVQFSCGHIIPPENILPLVLQSGPTGKPLNFSYESRSSPETIQEVERLLSNVCNLVPGGIVCFFPSYDYEQQVFSHLEKSGALEKLQSKKKVFREPKKSSQVEEVLRNYAQVIKTAKSVNTKMGALMLSVVGGKLSEGLNFSDDLGRLIIVIGMPYPNSKSAELQEKMKYLNTHVAPGTGQKHYEALCMKAVNQSIGRAIRHRGDYAAVILADSRYARPTVQAALPGWIQRSLKCCDRFGQALAEIRQFFAARKMNE